MKLTKEEFKQIRKDLGMTQAEFAREIGLGAGSRVSEIEKGTRGVSGPVAAASRMLISLTEK